MLVRTLLGRGAQVNAADDKGVTALMMANGAIPYPIIPGGFRGRNEYGKQTGRAESQEALLVDGAKPNPRNKKGETAPRRANSDIQPAINQTTPVMEELS